MLRVLSFRPRRPPGKFQGKGQTLIETIVAIFVLTTGLASGLALAVYSFGASSDISERIVATGLVREGTEAVRFMRDSNWMGDTLRDCDDINSGQRCYRNWLDQVFNIRPGGSPNGEDYRLRVSTIANRVAPCLARENAKFCLQRSPGGPPADYYRLYHVTAPVFRERITPDPSVSFGDTAWSPTNFFRKITLFRWNTDPPYSLGSPLLLVRSIVWWHGKGCNNSLTDWNASHQNPPLQTEDTRCKVISEEFLTNWKNY